VMNALARIPPAQGIAAMQSINVAVINPSFFAVFFGTALICLCLAVRSVLKWGQPGASLVLVASLLYLVGTILVTMAFNVPLNDALASVKPESVEGARLWATYLTRWTAWNHVRTLAAARGSGLVYDRAVPAYAAVAVGCALHSSTLRTVIQEGGPYDDEDDASESEPGDLALQGSRR
jgi:uncharacterized membrane protein